MRVLVLQLKRIGDLILTTPALWALRRHLPDAHITLAVDAGSRELLPAIDYADQTLVYERHGRNGPLWRRLVFRQHDVCLDFTGNDRSALFSALSKARRRIAFEWVQRARHRALFYNEFVASSVRENHTADHYCHLLRPLGVPVRKESPIMLRLPDWAARKAGQLLEEAGGGSAAEPRPYALVHPGTARPEKYWPADRWAAVIRWCETNLRMPCVISGSGDAHELAHIRAIREGAPSMPESRILAGRLDLVTLAALTRGAALVLSVDSAPMHMAAGFERPQVALFGPTNPYHWRPRHERAIVLQAHPPAGLEPFRPQQHGGPMTEISTAAVIDAIIALQAHA